MWSSSAFTYSCLRALCVERASPVIQEMQSTERGTSLKQVWQLAQKLGMKYRPAKRKPGARFIVPSVIHWKVGHFGALLAAYQEGKYLVQHPTFGSETTISPQALEEESSGYFLVGFELRLDLDPTCATALGR
jgi:ABC-type bacteriocin/lantibiotic exporter with double-glycine peptidase domain